MFRKAEISRSAHLVRTLQLSFMVRVALLILASQNASATVIVDSLGQPDVDGESLIDAGDAFAQSLTPTYPGGSQRLRTITVKLENFAASASALRVKLWSGPAAPTTELEDLGTVNLTGGGGVKTLSIDSTAQPELFSGTRYWVSIHAIDASDLDWVLTSTLPNGAGTLGSLNDQVAFSRNDGASWTAETSTTFALLKVETFGSIVTSKDDDGSNALGTLRDVLSDIPPGGTVTFAAALNGETISIEQELRIERSVTIDASGLSDGIKIDGGSNGDFVEDSGEFRCLHITDEDPDTQITVHLRNVTLQNGFVRNEAGANLYNDGEIVTLTNCKILDGRTSGNGGGGGGIYTSGELSLTNCQMSRNQTQGEFASGGAIKAEGGALTLTNCEVSDNETLEVESDGGGIFSDAGCVLTVLESRILRNHTRHFNDSGGGGIYVRSGSALHLSGSTVADNHSDVDGGGVYLLDAGGLVSDTTISSNVAVGRGGGVYHFNRRSESRLVLQRSTIGENASLGIRDDEETLPLGGGLMNRIGEVLLQECTLSGNKAIGGQGGGIVTGDSSAAITKVGGSIIAANSGGDVDLLGNGKLQSEGFNLIGSGSGSVAFSAVGGDQVDVSDPKLAPLGDYGGPTQTMLPLFGSPAIDPAGRAAILGGMDQRGFARDVDGDGNGTSPSDIGAVEVSGPIVVTTEIDENDGIAVGGVSLRDALDASVSASRIVFDAALAGKTIELIHGQLVVSRSLSIDASSLPGGVVIDGGSDGDFEQEGVETRCVLVSDGDGTMRIDVHLQSVTLQNGSFNGSDAGANLHNVGENVILTDCRILGGRAFDGTNGRASGGGIFSSDGMLTLVRCEVSGNQTEGGSSEGGGVFNRGGPVSLIDCSLFDNGTSGAEAHGGAMSLSGEVILRRCTVHRNEARGGAADGGGLYCMGDDLVVVDHCTFTGNSTGRFGGGMFRGGGDAEIRYATFSGNTADKGSEIAASGDLGGEITVMGSIVAGNGSDLDFVDLVNNVKSEGNNVIGTGSATLDFSAGKGDKKNVSDPGLASLRDYGGPTPTMALRAGSPAIDVVRPPPRSAIDQRGFARVVGARADSGAYESGNTSAGFGAFATESSEGTDPIDPNGNEDDDDVDNLREYAAGMEMGESDVSPEEIEIVLFGDPPSAHLVLRFPRRTDTPDLIYEVRVGASLFDLADGGDHEIIFCHDSVDPSNNVMTGLVEEDMSTDPPMVEVMDPVSVEQAEGSRFIVVVIRLVP